MPEPNSLLIPLPPDLQFKKQLFVKNDIVWCQLSGSVVGASFRRLTVGESFTVPVGNQDHFISSHMCAVLIFLVLDAVSVWITFI